MLRCSWVAFFASLIPLLAAPQAGARPQISIESIVSGAEFGRGDQCIAPGSYINVVGEGFHPGGRVRLGSGGVRRTGRHGRFSMLVRVEEPRRRGQERVVLRVSQSVRRAGKTRRLRASLSYWTATRGVDVPGWNTDGPEALGVPGEVERARAGAFDWGIGRSLYIHYVLEGRLVFAQRVATLRGPCGAAEFRLVQFGFAAPPAGLYRIDFGTGRTVNEDAGAGYRSVRLGAAPPPLLPSTAPLFTLAGGGAVRSASDAVPATSLALEPRASIAPRAGGGHFIGDAARVWAVDAGGHASTFAGTGKAGSVGDGGPATAAQVNVRAVAAVGDGLLIAQCDATGVNAEPTPPGRIRRVAVDGTIATVAGNGRRGSFREGAVATATSIECPQDVAVGPDGSIYIAIESRVLRVAPDGTVSTVAGTGEYPQSPRSGVARSIDVAPDGLAALPDGAVLIADGWACGVYRLANGRLTVVAGDGTEGRRNEDGALATRASVCPRAVAAAPDGGFYVADNGDFSLAGGQPRIRRITADGRIQTIAGSGRWAPGTSRSDELRGDGMPGRKADLRAVWDVAVLEDGGVAFSEATADTSPLAPGTTDPGLIRYLAPNADGMLAVALRRDRDRIFTAAQPARVTVSLTAAADVTIVARDGAREIARLDRTLAAGDSVVELPPLAGVPHIIELAAHDGRDRVATDRAAILPRGWLSEIVARSLASALVFTATDVTSAFIPAVRGCRRFGAGRVDCALVPEGPCAAVVTIRLAVDGRLRWGTYRCPIGRRHPVLKPLRRLRSRDYHCGETCDGRQQLSGVVPARWLVPWD